MGCSTACTLIVLRPPQGVSRDAPHANPSIESLFPGPDPGPDLARRHIQFAIAKEGLQRPSELLSVGDAFLAVMMPKTRFSILHFRSLVKGRYLIAVP
jgi:hypothetical protein